MVFMTAFILSPDRRDQLATLLADEVRLQTEYPKVAEYLDAAAELIGGPDPEQERLLDLRMLHFLSGGDSLNPYWDIVEPLVGEGVNGGRCIPGGGAGTARLGYAQTVLQETYAYAIPAPSTLDWIERVAGDRGICEVGAGRGYWAAMLADRGVEIAAFDSQPPVASANPSFPNAPGRRAEWHPVAGLPELEQVGFGDRVLFLCWPPGWGDQMSAKTLRQYVAAGGDQLIYIGEPKGGKTGCDEFFDALSDGWALEATDDSFVSWWNLDDAAQCWRLR
ncbi:hypothetical protein DFR75_103399 [Nocardia ignorata]|uniref:Methyltransferase family protein n=2 Tax=Nocardia ignorata TaxID=145285 RepID=A0A4V3CPN7_NOCIG|nr:hypothetical protein DFR75_103399 [Nocardia ignorata]